MSDNILALTERVCIELSNRCNYAYAHPRCPLHRMRGNPPIILPAKIVRHVLDTLGQYQFKGILSFHLYNEPMIDPRLFEFIEYARQVCPGACVDICTNGSYLSQVMLDELAEIGVESVRASCYSEAEYQRLSKLRTAIYYVPQRKTLDSEVVCFYEPGEGRATRAAGAHEPCLAPYMELCITRDGQVGLCFLDWKHQHSFGDLRKQTLEEIMRSDAMRSVSRQLRSGDRRLALCKTCGRSRYEGCVRVPPRKTSA